MSEQKTYTAEEIDGELALAKKYNEHDTRTRTVIRKGDRHIPNRVALTEIVEQFRRENARLERRIEKGIHATQLAFPEGLEYDKPYAAYYHAQHQYREALEEKP